MKYKFINIQKNKNSKINNEIELIRKNNIIKLNLSKNS